MNKCEICGRETNRTYHCWEYTLCSKHMHQYHKYGKFLDSISRTIHDLNDYVIQDDIVIFNLYNQRNEKNGEFIIDFEDIEKVKYHKWRISHNHVVTGQPAKHNQRDLAYVVLGVQPHGARNFVIDHINGNAFDNRKQNLRICSQSDNVCNKSYTSNNTSGFIGVSYRRDKERWDPEIRKDKVRCHLGYTRSKEEAVYKRYIAEQMLFGQFTNADEQERKRCFTANLSDDSKQRLQNEVAQKLQTKFLGD